MHAHPQHSTLGATHPARCVTPGCPDHARPEVRPCMRTPSTARLLPYGPSRPQRPALARHLPQAAFPPDYRPFTWVHGQEEKAGNAFCRTASARRRAGHRPSPPHCQCWCQRRGGSSHGRRTTRQRASGACNFDVGGQGGSQVIEFESAHWQALAVWGSWRPRVPCTWPRTAAAAPWAGALTYSMPCRRRMAGLSKQLFPAFSSWPWTGKILGLCTCAVNKSCPQVRRFSTKGAELGHVLVMGEPHWKPRPVAAGPPQT